MNSGSATKRAALLAFAFAVTAFSFTIAKADTIFDVEHARADARAGPVNSDDLEYLERGAARAATIIRGVATAARITAGFIRSARIGAIAEQRSER
jgi:hypothetical protein